MTFCIATLSIKVTQHNDTECINFNNATLSCIVLLSVTSKPLLLSAVLAECRYTVCHFAEWLGPAISSAKKLNFFEENCFGSANQWRGNNALAFGLTGNDLPTL